AVAGGLAYERAAHAGGHAGMAGPDVGAAGDAGAGQRALIDHAVAVVVDAVAHLLRGRARHVAERVDAVARDDAGARHRALVADVERRSGQRDAVVDQSVAVVVDAVAHFGQRRARQRSAARVG